MLQVVSGRPLAA